MRFFSFLLVSISISLGAQTNNDDWLADVLEKNKQATQRMARDGTLDSFRQQKVENDISSFIKEAQQIADNSQISEAKKQQDVNTLFGHTAAAIDALPKPSKLSASNSSRRSLSAIFVSFSMSDNEIRDAFIAAEQFGADVYFNGMHKDDENIMDTMNRIKAIMFNVSAKPRARFHPKAFTELNIQQVPVIFHAQRGNVGYVSGLMNFDWLKRQMHGLKGLNNFGKQGPTDPVEEENIIHVFQQRFMKLDMEKKREKAIEGFWAKQQFVSIPNATQNKVFYINPTVKVSQDIVNPNGEVLAKAGQVLNPITTVPTKNTYFLFDATNEDHVEWAQSKVDHSLTQGVQMFLTKRIHADNGWEQLNSLRNRFTREIYLIPQTMVDRFKISGLPAIVSTDVDKGLLRVELINLRGSSK